MPIWIPTKQAFFFSSVSWVVQQCLWAWTAVHSVSVGAHPQSTQTTSVDFTWWGKKEERKARGYLPLQKALRFIRSSWRIDSMAAFCINRTRCITVLEMAMFQIFMEPRNLPVFLIKPSSNWLRTMKLLVSTPSRVFQVAPILLRLARIFWHSWVLATANPLLQMLYEASTEAGVSYKCKHDPIRYLLHKKAEVMICSQDTKT